MSAEQIQIQLNSNAYFDLVSFSILFYEYCITLDWEISRYWGTRLSWPKALFFANRYGTLLGNIPVVMEYFWTENSTPTKIKVGLCVLCTAMYAQLHQICLGLESYHQYFIIATQILVGVMLILRTYALYGRSKRVLALILTVTAGVIVVGFWSVLTGKAVDKTTNLPLYFGCDYPTSKAQGLSLAAAWGGVAKSDRIFLLTLYKVFHQRRPNGSDLVTVLLRDGSVYFGVMLLSNLSNIATFVLGTPYTRGIATTFTNIISSVMITRLMLNIRDPALAHMAGTHSTSATANLRFAPYRREGETGQAGVDLDTDVDATTDIELTNLNLNRRTAPGPDPHQAGGSSSRAPV
ncbi:hypothetical protein DFH08DRAFT_976369 [Mycena albidolilacea]|uniref:DUF6533 domain-containing protein n=1 Tax=Mycena albidolilacea TaxID=1033008 RepID=A0AAD7E9L8_9AGAR|nr:hypothetical protein DFH08DRAFT_976369 [Mycena albidolilacea]